jgi:hypothetical protein
MVIALGERDALLYLGAQDRQPGTGGHRPRLLPSTVPAICGKPRTHI